MSKRAMAMGVIAPAAVVLGLSLLTWVRGSAPEALAHGTTAVRGAGATPGGIGLVLICVILLVAQLIVGPGLRRFAAWLGVLAALGATTLIVRVALFPAESVAASIAGSVGRSTVEGATGSTTWAVWAGLVGSVALVLGTVRGALSVDRWGGLSSRYERERPKAGPLGQVRTTWDELSDGEDPTLRDGPAQT